jgi:hypothetical protein
MPQIAQTFPYFFLNQGKRRQAVINGNMDIWQRGTPLNNVKTLDYTADRWTHYFDGWGGDLNVSKEEVPSTYTEVRRDCVNCMKMEWTAGWAGQTINRFYYLIPDVHYSNGEVMSIGFWMWASRDITLPSFKLRQKYGYGGSPSTTVTIPIATSIAVGTTPKYYQFQVIPASTAGKTLGTSGDDCLSVDLYMPLNEEFTVYTTGWVINTGEACLPIVKKSYEETLNECQQFYKRIKVRKSQNLGTGLAISTEWAMVAIPYSRMRLEDPVVTLSPASEWRIQHLGSVYTPIQTYVYAVTDTMLEIHFKASGTVLTKDQPVTVYADGGISGNMVEITTEF